MFIKDKVQLLENVIPEEVSNQIEELMLNDSFPWYFYPTHVVPENDSRYYAFDQTNVVETPGLLHNFCENGSVSSNYSQYFIEILQYIEMAVDVKIDKLFRIRGRLSLRHPGNENTHNGVHIDYHMDEDFYSMIYYVNDSDGDTVIFDKREGFDVNEKPTIIHRFKPKKGNFLLFDGKMYHAGNFPVQNASRAIINYDFTVK